MAGVPLVSLGRGFECRTRCAGVVFVRATPVRGCGGGGSVPESMRGPLEVD